MSAKDIFALIFALLVGSGSSAGLGVYFIRRTIEKKLLKYEKEAQDAAELKKQLSDAESRLHHAYERMFFWIYRAITTGKYSDELGKAFSELESAKEERGKVEREIISIFNSEK